MTNNNSYTEQVEDSKTKVKITLSLEERMRILANLMIDRILDDYRKDRLKFTLKSSNMIMEHSNRNKNEN